MSSIDLLFVLGGEDRDVLLEAVRSRLSGGRREIHKSRPLVCVDGAFEDREEACRELTRQLSGEAWVFRTQTTVDYFLAEHYRDGELLRRLEFLSEDGGWIRVEGEDEDWESLLFEEPEDDGLGEYETDLALYEAGEIRVGEFYPYPELYDLSFILMEIFEVGDIDQWWAEFESES